MFELEKTSEVNELIAITKSGSGISGPSLAKAHIRLGELLASNMTFSPKETAIVAVMRGGIFFAEGMYFKLGCRFDIYDPKNMEFERPDVKNVILVDSVINTGKTLRDILTPDMYVASCVASEKAAAEFGKNLYTVRISKNSFVGSNVKVQKGGRGPDTTMRLFNQL